MSLSMEWRRAAGRFAAFGLALLLAVSGPAVAQKVALTFDDGLNPTEQDRAAEWNAAILRALSDAKVGSMIFPAGRRVDNPEGLALVREWGLAGHGIANHTYAHMNLNAKRTSADAFIADAEKAQALLEDLPGWTARLRFPYLKEGDTAAKRDAVRAGSGKTATDRGRSPSTAATGTTTSAIWRGGRRIPTPIRLRSARRTWTTCGAGRSITTGCPTSFSGAVRGT